LSSITLEGLLGKDMSALLLKQVVGVYTQMLT
jgi:hypothetical protein